MTTETANEEGNARAALARYIRTHSTPPGRIRWIDSVNTEDFDAAIDLGSGERFVRISYEAATEVRDLVGHMTRERLIEAIETCPAHEQIIVATHGLSRQLVRDAFR